MKLGWEETLRIGTRETYANAKIIVILKRTSDYGLVEVVIMKPMNGTTHHMENSVSNRNALERGHGKDGTCSSPHTKKFAFQERDSTWKVSY